MEGKKKEKKKEKFIHGRDAQCAKCEQFDQPNQKRASSHCSSMPPNAPVLTPTPKIYILKKRVTNFKQKHEQSHHFI